MDTNLLRLVRTTICRLIFQYPHDLEKLDQGHQNWYESVICKVKECYHLAKSERPHFIYIVSKKKKKKANVKVFAGWTLNHHYILAWLIFLWVTKGSWKKKSAFRKGIYLHEITEYENCTEWLWSSKNKKQKNKKKWPFMCTVFHQQLHCTFKTGSAFCVCVWTIGSILSN